MPMAASRRMVAIIGFLLMVAPVMGQESHSENGKECTECSPVAAALVLETEPCLDCEADTASIFTRPTLTGDWHRLRTDLQEAGITFSGRSTHFGFGLSGGINHPVPPPLCLGDLFRYTGRNASNLLFDLEKFGGLSQGTLLIRAEQWFGEFGNVTLNAGAFPLPIFTANLPPRLNDPGMPYITDFLLMQSLSEEVVVFAGKPGLPDRQTGSRCHRKYRAHW